MATEAFTDLGVGIFDGMRDARDQTGPGRVPQARPARPAGAGRRTARRLENAALTLAVGAVGLGIFLMVYGTTAMILAR